VVEDNEVNARIACAMLQRLGWTVSHVTDGVEALAAIEKRRFDIVWMDCQMPRMDGFTATRALRERERQGGLPPTYVVALTANAVTGDREACMAAGMDDYISKPMRPANLKEAIERWRAPREASPIDDEAPIPPPRPSAPAVDPRSKSQLATTACPGWSAVCDSLGCEERAPNRAAHEGAPLPPGRARTSTGGSAPAVVPLGAAQVTPAGGGLR
jgi:CheY-like chemotaxis protein